MLIIQNEIILQINAILFKFSWIDILKFYYQNVECFIAKSPNIFFPSCFLMK